jgi:hypothetical protein
LHQHPLGFLTEPLFELRALKAFAAWRRLREILADLGQPLFELGFQDDVVVHPSHDLLDILRLSYRGTGD